MNFLGKLEMVEMETIEQLVQSAGKAFQNVLNILSSRFRLSWKWNFIKNFIKIHLINFQLFNFRKFKVLGFSITLE